MKKYAELEIKLQKKEITVEQILSEMVNDLENLGLEIVEKRCSDKPFVIKKGLYENSKKIILNDFYFDVVCKPHKGMDLLEIAKKIKRKGLFVYELSIYKIHIILVVEMDSKLLQGVS